MAPEETLHFSRDSWPAVGDMGLSSTALCENLPPTSGGGCRRRSAIKSESLVLSLLMRICFRTRD
jgi:hypothetical protein